MPNVFDQFDALPHSAPAGMPPFMPLTGPNPKLPAEVAVGQGEAARQPALTSKAGSDAASAAAAAGVAGPMAGATLTKEQAAAAEAAVKAAETQRQLRDFFTGKTQMTEGAKTLLGTILNTEVKAQQPHTTGPWDARMGSFINNLPPVDWITGGYKSSNQGMLASGLSAANAAMAAFNAQAAKSSSPTGVGAPLPVRNVLEFMAQSAAAGAPDPAGNRETIMRTLSNYERGVRSLLALQSGIDPNKVDVMNIPLGRLGVPHLKFDAPLDTGSDLYRRLSHGTPSARLAPAAGNGLPAGVSVQRVQ